MHETRKAKQTNRTSCNLHAQSVKKSKISNHFHHRNLLLHNAQNSSEFHSIFEVFYFSNFWVLQRQNNSTWDMFHKIKDGANAWTCELLIQNQYYASRSLACPSERQQQESACLRLHISTSYIFLTLEYIVSQYSALQLIICTREPTKSRNLLASRIWSQHNLKNFNQSHIQNKTFTYDHDISLYRLKHICNGSWVVSTEKNVNSKFKPPAMLVFLVFRKSDPMFTDEYFSYT
jgi:hypothetical protein